MALKAFLGEFTKSMVKDLAEPYQSLQPAQKCTEKTVTVIYPYEEKWDDELAMKPGDVISVDDWDVSKDWARGTLNGKTRLFYKAFTKPSSEVPSPDDFKFEEVRGKPQGYDATYLGREHVLKEKLDEVECIICHELADNVHQTSCCGNTICLGCAKTWKAKNNSCPQCRKQPLKVVEDPKTQRRITGATVYCPNHHFGCKWVGSFGRVAEHLESDCESEGKVCSNCNEAFPQTFLEIHESKLCLLRKEECPCCGKGRTHSASSPAGDSLWHSIKSVFTPTVTYYDIITDHHQECRSWPTRCPKYCDPYLTLTRSTVDGHLEEDCLETVVGCKFAEVGCKVKVKRKDLPQHMQEAMSDHVTAMFEDHIELKSDHMKMKRENAQLKRELDQLKSRKK